MASKVEICNLAILGAGGNTVNSIPEAGANTEADACDLLWDHCLEEVLSDYHWTFAKKWISFASIAGYTFIDDEFEYAFQKPADYVRWSDQENTGPSRNNFAWRENVLLCNVDVFEAEYIAKIEDTTKYPIWFRTVLVAKLESKLGPILKKKGYEKINWEQRYVLILGYNAPKDANEQHRTADRTHHHTASNDSWLGARL